MAKPLPSHYVNEDEERVPLPTRPVQLSLGSEREQVLEAQVRVLAHSNKKLVNKLNWWRRGTEALMEKLARFEAIEAGTLIEPEKKSKAPKKKKSARRVRSSRSG